MPKKIYKNSQKHISSILRSNKITPGGLTSLKKKSKAIKKNRQMKSLESPSMKKAKSLIVSIPFNKLNAEKEINVDNSTNINDDNQLNGS